MRIATWNINGVKARFEQLLKWLEEESPDIVGNLRQQEFCARSQ